MLSISDWWINIVHLAKNLLVEVIWGEELRGIRVFDPSFVSWVDISQVFSASRPPSFRRNQRVIEDLLGIDLDQPSVSVIGNPTSVVGCRN